MRVMQIGLSLALALFVMCCAASSEGEKLTVTGKLIHVMAIGGESTGWSIQLESEISIDGQPVDSLEVDSRSRARLDTLANKRVQATGTLTRKQGVETGSRSILDISEIGEAQDNRGTPQSSGTSPAEPAAINLTRTAWVLQDLAGSGVAGTVYASLTFPEARKVAGNGSCNRFFGAAEIRGNVIKLGPLGTTRMACAEAVMNQESKYLKALQAAESFEWQRPYLLLHCKGLEKPLRFVREKP